ncbi:hypothetical protein SLEP1_g55995 [Rubroshorea leprosula]|uniref:Integrase catalytic domain-containing protein n=1 Tax=Rubroshorea leprosula TaxID=152421 RepID=A0AAV5MIA9_9ROSI|nr:hypothetical protein SLEP1_g55995 [Rubroshorea leprosula]
MVKTRSAREGEDENQPHNSARNSASTANQDVVATQLAAMQQQFGVFQLVLAQLLARNNPGDPLINLLNPAPPQPPAPPQNPEPVQHAPARGAPPPHPAADSVPHPLNTNIILEPYPAGFRIPQLETYDGTKDPDDHLHAFYSCMQAQNVSDALMCKIFPSTLRGNARTWYYSLPPRSINSYTKLASAFATKFSSRRLIRKTTSELMRVKQRDGESLKNFMSRFNDAVLEVNSFDQAVGITAVISGLSHERFRDSLLKHPANTFSEIKNKMDLRRPGPMRTAAATRDHTSQGLSENKGHSIKQSATPQTDKNQTQKRKFDDAEWKNQPITFTSADLETVVTPHNDPLVTSVTINNCEVQRVLVDTGSAPDIMYFHCFESLGLDPALLQRYDGPIYGFNNQPVPVERVFTMNVAFGSGRSYMTPSVRFLVVKMASSFNAVIGRPTLTEIRAVVSQSHLCMKFPTPTGIATLRGNQEVARHCYITSVTQPQKGKDQTPEVNPKRIPDDRQVMGVEIVDNRPEDETRVAPVEDVEEVQIDDRDPSRKTQIGTKLNPEERAELIAFLRANKDALADFIVECTPGNSIPTPEPNDWTLYVDGASSSKGLGAGALLIGLDGYRSEHALKFNFDATNNMAEYEALLLALVAELKCRFQKFCLSKIPRTENEQADSLSKFASDNSSHSRLVFLEVLDEPNFMKPRVMEISTDPSTPSWTDPILSFLRDGIVPEDRQEAMKLRRKASRYTLVDGILYKRSFSLPLLRCLNPYEAEYALREVHEGVCGSHVGARTLAHKVLRQGYYWPNMYKDATHFVQRCLKCQFFAHLTHQPAEELTTPFTSIYHPESNGMVESINKCILEGIKPRLEQHKAKWADELNNVLWAYRTTIYKQKIANFYNKRVRPRTFKVGDLVLRKAGLTGFETRFGKLAPNWEGPYTVAEVPHPGAYILRDTEGKRVPRVWNVNNLKKFYP